MTALRHKRGVSLSLQSAATLFAAMLLASCGKTPQQGFQDGMEAYGKGDYKTAMDNWKPVADGGDAAAETNVGLLYSQGKGIKQDYAQALDWYKKAAMQNYPDAEYNLGVLYQDGKGIAADPKEARRWFTYSANSGNVRAQMKLADIYMKGAGVDVDTKEAVKWLEMAADKGNPQAELQLGDMYARGNGVPQDHVHAYVWYTQAVMQEDDDMVRARASIGRMRVLNEMDEVELAEAERQSEEQREIRRTEANQ
jgi:TPR repeat protein